MEETGSGILDAAAKGREQRSFETTTRFYLFCSTHKVYFLMLPSQINNNVYIKTTAALHTAIILSRANGEELTIYKTELTCYIAEYTKERWCVWMEKKQHLFAKGGLGQTLTLDLVAVVHLMLENSAESSWEV